MWGSKNLIAVAVKGSQKVQAADPDRFKGSLKKAFTEIRDNPMFIGMKEGGTIGDLPGNDYSGDWQTMNWQSNSRGKGSELFDHYAKNNF